MQFCKTAWLQHCSWLWLHGVVLGCLKPTSSPILGRRYSAQVCMDAMLHSSSLLSDTKILSCYMSSGSWVRCANGLLFLRL